jgi:hypothetical protein
VKHGSMKNVLMHLLKCGLTLISLGIAMNVFLTGFSLCNCYHYFYLHLLRLMKFRAAVYEYYAWSAMLLHNYLKCQFTNLVLNCCSCFVRIKLPTGTL